jgi:hypothetical protein
MPAPQNLRLPSRHQRTFERDSKPAAIERESTLCHQRGAEDAVGIFAVPKSSPLVQFP